MSYQPIESADAVILNPPQAANAAVIWLHGLGADGYDFVPIVQELRLPQDAYVRFIFPHAHPRPVTINNGYVMRAWYDIKAIGGTGPEDEAGIRESQQVVEDLIARELQQGIAAQRIVLAGFSQGGAIALQTGLRYQEVALGGILALSTYLPLRESLSAEASSTNRDIPILMCHGTQDGIVSLQMGETSRDAMTQLGFAVDWRTYPMQHQVCPQEIDDISQWLTARLQ